MINLSWQEAFDNIAALSQTRKFPNRRDQRYRGGNIFPNSHPSFSLQVAQKIFTIGSCFARNIEEKLVGFDLPTVRFSVPKPEWPIGRPNGLLNEYNPGTMCQRILYALSNNRFSESTIVDVGDDSWIDLLLPGDVPVPRKRAVARREEIDQVYSELATSDVVIITLGLTEAWYDTETNLYLNRIPPIRMMKAHPTRFQFRILEVFDALPLLDAALKELVNRSINVLLTVSPVPLSATFSGRDPVISNCYSKSILRVCAQLLADKYEGVDYFPSYEIVTSGGLANFVPDNVHILDDVVGEITSHMMATYLNREEIRNVG